LLLFSLCFSNLHFVSSSLSLYQLFISFPLFFYPFLFLYFFLCFIPFIFFLILPSSLSLFSFFSSVFFFFLHILQPLNLLFIFYIISPFFITCYINFVTSSFLLTIFNNSTVLGPQFSLSYIFVSISSKSKVFQIILSISISWYSSYLTSYYLPTTYLIPYHLLP